MHRHPGHHWLTHAHSTELQSTSHSLEVERRLTETKTMVEGHEERISFLERALRAVIYVLGALSASKVDEAAELLLTVLKKT